MDGGRDERHSLDGHRADGDCRVVAGGVRLNIWFLTAETIPGEGLDCIDQNPDADDGLTIRDVVPDPDPDPVRDAGSHRSGPG